MRCLGFVNLLGIDPFRERDLYMRGGPTILKRSLPEVNGEFDVVVLNHSFEHMANPLSVFVDLKRLLAPDGSIVIRTPVASSLAWRKYGVNWVQLDAPRHLVVHTLKSIQVLADACNLKVESVTFDSTAFQFWGSEQYEHGISLNDPRSYKRSARQAIFRSEAIDAFAIEAGELNKRGDGDQACFRLRA
jgi:SAM-dependent methyltransferase